MIRRFWIPISPMQSLHTSMLVQARLPPDNLEQVDTSHDMDDSNSSGAGEKIVGGFDDTNKSGDEGESNSEPEPGQEDGDGSDSEPGGSDQESGTGSDSELGSDQEDGAGE